MRLHARLHPSHLKRNRTEKYPAVWLRSSLLRRSLEETYLKLAEQMAKRETLAQSMTGSSISNAPSQNSGRSAGNSCLSNRAASTDSIHQGRARGASCESGTLRLAGVFEFIEIVAEKDHERMAA